MNILREYLIKAGHAISDCIESLGSKSTPSEKRKRQLRRFEEKQVRLTKDQNFKKSHQNTVRAAKLRKVKNIAYVCGGCLIGLTALIGILKIKQNQNYTKKSNTIIAAIESAFHNGDLNEAYELVRQSQNANPKLRLKENKKFIALQENIIEKTYFARAGRFFDSGNMDAALVAYTDFVREYPTSAYVNIANERIPIIKEKVEAQDIERELRARTLREEAAARALVELDNRAHREMVNRIRTGSLTVDEWKPILKGKTMIQVHELLGPPDSTWDQDAQWVYYRRIIHPVTLRPAAMYINFHNTGLVNTFSASATGTRWEP